jgi:hypothetical protein
LVLVDRREVFYVVEKDFQRCRTQAACGLKKSTDIRSASVGNMGGHYPARTQRVDLLDWRRERGRPEVGELFSGIACAFVTPQQHCPTCRRRASVGKKTNREVQAAAFPGDRGLWPVVERSLRNHRNE